jgi:hypothetical protein
VNRGVIKFLWVPWRVGRVRQPMARIVINARSEVSHLRWTRLTEASFNGASTEEARPVGDGGRAKILLLTVQKAGTSGYLYRIRWHPAPGLHDRAIGSVEASHSRGEPCSAGDRPIEADARTMKPRTLWDSVVK